MKRVYVLEPKDTVAAIESYIRITYGEKGKMTVNYEGLNEIVPIEVTVEPQVGLLEDARTGYENGHHEARR